MTKHFAFYGRVSTEDQQDPTSSRNWQLARSRQVIEPAGGEIVEEFFDIGQSRSLPWKRRRKQRDCSTRSAILGAASTLWSSANRSARSTAISSV